MSFIIDQDIRLAKDTDSIEPRRIMIKGKTPMRCWKQDISYLEKDVKLLNPDQKAGLDKVREFCCDDCSHHKYEAKKDEDGKIVNFIVLRCTGSVQAWPLADTD